MRNKFNIDNSKCDPYQPFYKINTCFNLHNVKTAINELY
jgi:hypothetical protein